MTGSMRSSPSDKLPITAEPSWQNIVAGFYNNLPEALRRQIPMAKIGQKYWPPVVEKPPSSNGEPDKQVDEESTLSKPPADKRGDIDWADVCFIHSVPGDDEDEGLIVLADGSFRRYMACKGINALLFDEADVEALARNFKEFANSCESDVQIIVKSRNLPVDEYLSRYQNQVTTDNDYLKWYAKNTDQWFRRVQDVHFVPQRDFYVVISYSPPDTVDIANDIWSTLYNHLSSSNSWSGKRTAAKHDEYVETLNRYTRTAFEQLRQSNLRPQVLKRSEVRDLIYGDLNPGLAAKRSKSTTSSSRHV